MMSGRDPSLYPETIYVVRYSGGEILVEARSVSEAREFICREKEYSHGRVVVAHFPEDQVYECLLGGMELVCAFTSEGSQ